MFHFDHFFALDFWPTMNYICICELKKIIRIFENYYLITRIFLRNNFNIMKKKITLFNVLLLLCFYAAIPHANAQAPDWLWATNAGDNSYDEAYTVTYDTSGNIYVAGYYNTYIFDLPLSHGPDAYLVEFSPGGNILWTGGISDTGAERITNIAFDKLGNYFILGLFDGNQLDICSEHFVNSNPSAYDIFLAKYDSQHNCIWVRSAGGTDEDTPTGLVVDSIGNCYITGYYNSPSINFGIYPLVNSGGGNSDIFVAKYDPEGTALWARSATGTTGGIEVSRSIAVDKLGNSYITGNFNSDSVKFDGIVLEKVSNINMYIAKLAPNGAVAWANRANCNGDSYGYSVAVDPENNCYATGSFKNTLQIGDTTFTSAGYRDIFTVKYDPANTVLWATAAGSTADDEPYAVATDYLGYCYLTGIYKSPTISFGSWPLTNNSNAGFADIFVTEYDSYGGVVWAKSIGGLTNDNPNAIAPDLSRNFVIAASLGSTSIIVGDTTLYNAGTVDALVVKSGNTPATGITETVGMSGISLYPNPAKDFIVIGGVENSEIEIFDMQGQLCRKLILTSAEMRINISDLKAGVYFINARNDKFFRTIRLIKI